MGVTLFFQGVDIVIEQSREVDQAVAALTTEILKLTPLEGEARAALCVTIENAISRLAIAILAQVQESQQRLPEAAVLTGADA